MGILGGLAFACLVGGLRLSTAIYHNKVGGNIQEEDYLKALRHFQQAEEIAQALDLEALRVASLLNQASLYNAQGIPWKAAELLSMEEGFKTTIEPDDWLGPSGGMLYKNISCWKDLILYQGKVEIRIFARGEPVKDIWPRMRVKLGDKTLGEVDVTSKEIQPYIFHASVDSGQQRLEVSLLNDEYNLQPYWNRDLWIEEAEIHYQEVAW